MAENKKVRWGLLSTGNICKDFCNAFHLGINKDEAEIVAVASRTKESADAFGDAYSVPTRYGSYEELAKDPNVDVIYIGSPHSFHKDHTLLCLNNGKPVLCEKAFTLNAKELEELIKVATEKNLFLMEAMWMRYLPSIRKVESLIAEGAIGEVKYIHAQFGFEMKPDSNKRLYDPELGGGALLDIGVYCLTLIYAILGKPEKIAAMGHVINNEYDFQTSIILGYPKAQATASCGLGAEYPSESVIVGTKGVIKIPHAFWCADRIIVNDEELSFPLATDKCKFVFRNSLGLHYEAKYVNECLKNKKLQSETHSLQDSLEIMKILDEIRKQIGLVYPVEK